MAQTICAIMGATGSIGFALASIAAERGYSLVLHGRSAEKLEPLCRRLLKEFTDLPISLVNGSLETARGAHEVADEIAQATPKLGLLINNAGVLMRGENITPDGLDMHVQINLIAPYILMNELKSNLSAVNGTVINVSSGAVLRAKDISATILRQPEATRKLFGAYAQSKQAMAIATSALADSFASAEVFAVSADPGPTKTNMTSGEGMPRLLRPLIYASTEQGARNIFAGADNAAVKNRAGAYMTKGREKSLAEFARNPAITREVLNFCGLQSDPSKYGSPN